MEKRRFQIILYVAIFCVLSFFFFGMVAYGILLLPPVQTKAVNLVANQLSRIITGDIRIGQVRSNLLTYITLKDLSIRDRVNPEVYVSASEIKFGYYLPSLLKKKIRITHSNVEQLNVHLRIRKDKKMEIPFLLNPDIKLKKNKMFTNWDLKLGPLKVKELNATFHDSLLNYYSAANKTACVARFPKLDSVLISVNAPDGYFYSNWWNGHIDTLQTDVVITPRGMNIDHCYAQGSGSKANGYGWIPFNYDDPWDLHATASSKTRPIYALETYAPDFDTVGYAQATAHFKGSFKKPLYFVDLKGHGVSYSGIMLDTFYFKGWTDENEDIHYDFKGDSPYGKMKLDGAVRIIHLNSFHPIVDKYTIHTKIEKIKTASFVKYVRQLENVPGDSARLNLYLDGKGYRDIPENVRLEVAAYQGNLKDTLQFAAAIRNNAWSMYGVWGNNEISGDGSFDLKGGVNGKISGKLNDVNPLFSYFVKENVLGKLQFESVVSGKVNAPAFNAKVNSNGLKWRGSVVDTLNAIIQIGKKINFNDAFCSANISLDSIGSFFKIADLKGKTSIAATINGDLKKPHIAMMVKGNDLFYKQKIADTIDGNIIIDSLNRFDAGKLRIKNQKSQIILDGSAVFGGIIHKKGNIGFDLSASADLVKDNIVSRAGLVTLKGLYTRDTININVYTNEFNVEVLNPWVEKTGLVNGLLSVRTSVNGTIKNPCCTLSAVIKKPSYRDIQLNSVKTKFVFADSLFKIDSAEFKLDSVSTLYFSGNVPVSPGNGWKLDPSVNRKCKVYVQSSKLDLEYLSRTFKTDWKYTGKGLISLEIGANGQAWNINGIATANNASLYNNALKLQCTNVDLDTKIQGQLFKPDISFTVNSGRVLYDLIKFDSTAFTGLYSKDTVHIITGSASMFNGGSLTTDGTIPFDSLTYGIDESGVKLNCNLVNVALPEMNVFTGNELIRSGLLNANGVLGLNNGIPVVNGRVSVSNAVFAVDGVEPYIGPLNGDFVLKDDTVKVVQCKGYWGKGTLESIGFIVWCPDSLKDVALTGQLRNLNADLPDIASTNIRNLRFSFSKRKKDYLFSGTADVGATRIFRDFKINDIIDQFSYTEPVIIEDDPLLQKIKLNIKINMLENPIIDINLGYIEFKGALSVTGSAAHPSFVGDLSVDNGYVSYLGKQFAISNGHLSNYDADILNPEVDLNALTNVAFLGEDSVLIMDTVKLRISGTLDKIKFKLSSASQTLTEADIISILTFGEKLASVGGDLKQRIITFASQAIFGFGSRKLEQLLDIDRINLDGDLFDMSKEKSPTLTVVKRISPKLMVTYETAIANLSRRKISAFYSLTKYFYLRGETENKGESGIDFIFKYSK
jgi:TamB, inner membrane protein subunit of TAM complex